MHDFLSIPNTNQTN